MWPPVTPCPPQPCCSMSPHISVGSHQHRGQCWQPKEGAGGHTDRQTDRHLQDTQALLQNCLQLAPPAQQGQAVCAPNPPLSSAGAARWDRRFTGREAPKSEHLPAWGGRDGWRSPGRVGGKGGGGHPCGSKVVGAGGQPGALLLPAASESRRFSRSRLLRRLLTQAAPHARASATSTFTLRKSSR